MAKVAEDVGLVVALEEDAPAGLDRPQAHVGEVEGDGDGDGAVGHAPLVAEVVMGMEAADAGVRELDLEASEDALERTALDLEAEVADPLRKQLARQVVLRPRSGWGRSFQESTGSAGVFGPTRPAAAAGRLPQTRRRGRLSTARQLSGRARLGAHTRAASSTVAP